MELIPGKLYKLIYPFEKKIYKYSLKEGIKKGEHHLMGIIPQSPPQPIVFLIDKGQKIAGLSSMYEYKVLYKDIIGYIDLPSPQHLVLIKCL